VLVFELCTLACAFLVNICAVFTGVSQTATFDFWEFDLHLNGWTLLLPEVAVISIARKYRSNYLAIRESNPSYEGPWVCRVLFDRCSAACCYAVFFTLTLSVMVPMGYGGKAILWAAAGGDFEKSIELESELDSDGTSLTWRLDPAHFYIASLIFCLLAFVGYLISITVLVARQNPRRMTCLKIAGSLLAFELAVIATVWIPPTCPLPPPPPNTHPIITPTAPSTQQIRRYAWFPQCGRASRCSRHWSSAPLRSGVNPREGRVRGMSSSLSGC
jgi:hypothetical protein